MLDADRKKRRATVKSCCGVGSFADVHSRFVNMAYAMILLGTVMNVNVAKFAEPMVNLCSMGELGSCEQERKGNPDVQEKPFDHG